MPANMVLLEKITVGAAGASSVTFSGIPQTGYTDLVVKISAREATSTEWAATWIYNGSSSSQTQRIIQGNGAAVSSASYSNLSFIENSSGATANTFGNAEIYIPNYASSNFKSSSSDSVSETNATTAYARLSADLWSNTAAINSITISTISGNFAQYSTFYLYGVAKLGTTPAIVPYATGGDTIMTDGTYWYHAFKSSGTFTPQKALSCDYLVVAGGGSGGAGRGGGGGAGGLRSTVTATGGGGSLESALSLASGTGYTVTIGAGGAIPSANNARGNDGSNSVFSTITSYGGGAGGNQNFGATNNAVIGNAGSTGVSTGFAGGSGGGSGGRGEAYSGGTGATGQGYAGGTSSGISLFPTGGGGGAGAVGANAVSGTASGNGGVGVQITAFATATSTGANSGYYAGGGGGGCDGATLGTGGLGGGGGASASSGGNPGIANTGGGGGGSASTTATDVTGAGAGGSGLVIVRYLV